jgi:hypothetical protein
MGYSEKQSKDQLSSDHFAEDGTPDVDAMMHSVNRTGSHVKKLISWVEDGQSLIIKCLRVP